MRVIGADVYTSKDEILTGSVDVENFEQQFTLSGSNLSQVCPKSRRLV